MKIIIAIGIGSFIGGILRYCLSQFVQLRYASEMPYGTFLVNISGCFLIGVVYALADRSLLTTEWRLFFATGILGGFTTFSAFSFETLSLFKAGQVWTAVVYAVCSVLIGLIATFLGMYIVKISGSI